MSLNYSVILHVHVVWQKWILLDIVIVCLVYHTFSSVIPVVSLAKSHNTLLKGVLVIVIELKQHLSEQNIICLIIIIMVNQLKTSQFTYNWYWRHIIWKLEVICFSPKGKLQGMQAFCVLWSGNIDYWCDRILIIDVTEY